MTGMLEKFALLMWKNFILQLRNRCTTATLIVLPVILGGLLILLRNSVIKTEKQPAISYPTFNPTAGADKR